MSLTVIGHSERGSSHVLKAMPCQDSYCKRNIDEGDSVAVAVADGHGSQSCPYSDEGSKIAASIFCEQMYHLYHSYGGQTRALSAYLYREGSMSVVQSIVKEWRTQIHNEHTQKGRTFPTSDTGTAIDEISLFHMYGTTLIGMMVTPDFHFALQIGDGDIAEVSERHANALLEADQILGVETHSLCDHSPWKYAHTLLRHVNDDKPFAYILTTDGFKNSHASQSDYEKSCVSYIDVLNENGAMALEQNLPDWLYETSSQGCGDDITMVIISNHEEPESKDQTDQISNPVRLYKTAVWRDPHTGQIEKYGVLYDPQSERVIGYEAIPIPGRNDPCPCKSGLKYKKCCGRS